MSIRIILSTIIGAMLALIISFACSSETMIKPKQHQIVISGFEFVPNQLKVSQGDTVTWVNKDIVPHNIAIDTKQKSLSPEIASGEKFVYKVSKSLSYICGLHPSMRGKLILSP